MIALHTRRVLVGVSLVRVARLAAPLMKNGGTTMAMSYQGANSARAALTDQR